VSLARNLVRIGSLAVVVTVVVFVYAGAPASSATTYDVKVGGELNEPNVTKGVIWFNGYDPGTILIQPGDTLLWEVAGGVHSVTSTSVAANGSFVYDSSPAFPVAAAIADLGPGLLLGPGDTFDLATSALAPGTYTYFCKIHPGMVGTLAVTVGPATQAVMTVVAGFGDSVFAQQAFSPASLTVAQGTLVRWTLMNPTEPHTVTAANGAWDSSPNFNPPGPPPVMVPGTPTATFSWTFNTPGTFTYFCKLHAYKVGDSWVGMVGTVIVQPSPAAAVVNATNLAYIGIGLGAVALVVSILAVLRRRP